MPRHRSRPEPPRETRPYAAQIGHIELSPTEYDDLVSSPFGDERLVAEQVSAIVVDCDASTGLASPGSLPVVVVAVGRELGGDGPDGTDIIVGHADLGPLLTTIEAAPLAAVSLAVLLRSLPDVSVEQGLAMESAVYSMLQGGPEFARWRGTAPTTAIRDDGPTVLVDRADATLRITLNRPHRHNAITAQLRDELADALWLAVADDSVERIELEGAGPSFCSGGDLAEFGLRTDPVSAHRVRLARSPARLLHRLRRRLTVHIHGSTLGGGIEMAAFAERVIAHRDTSIALPEIGLGLIPGAGGTVSLTRRIGRQRAAALALTATTITAARARDWGLVDEIEAAE